MHVVAAMAIAVTLLALAVPADAGSAFLANVGTASASARIDFQITIPRAMSLQIGPTATIPVDANIYDPGGAPPTQGAAGNARRMGMSSAIRLPSGLATTGIGTSGAAVAQVAGRSLPLSLTASNQASRGRVTYTASAP
jgi:hypothetical protein